MATVIVKSTRKDNRVAFFERDPAHPKGQVFVRGDSNEVEVGDTRAVRKAIRDNKLVLTQETTATQQTPGTTNQGKGGKAGAGKERPPATGEPWPGYNDASDEDVIAKLGSLDDAGRLDVLRHERSNKKRAAIIEKLVNWNS